MRLTVPPPIQFLDAASLFCMVDHELELVEPHARYIDDMVASCQHPLTQRDMPTQAKTNRDSLLNFLDQHPRGRWQEDPTRQVAAAYMFWLRLRPDHNPAPPAVPMAGTIGLRLGHDENLLMYLGHIGYHVLPPVRGHHYAERACRLLLPLARAHGMKQLIITCNPDNTPSRRTCERLGARYIETVKLPRGNALYQQGDREKCRYILDL